MNPKSFLKGDMAPMKELFLALIAGIICGLVFKFLKLPSPSPPVFAGIMGIIGIFLGGKLFDFMMKYFT